MEVTVFAISPIKTKWLVDALKEKERHPKARSVEEFQREVLKGQLPEAFKKALIHSAGTVGTLRENWKIVEFTPEYVRYTWDFGGLPMLRWIKRQVFRQHKTLWEKSAEKAGYSKEFVRVELSRCE